MSKLVLFQGDSITDAGRDRGNPYEMGRGYPMLVSAALGVDRPGEFTYLNRGVGGDRIVDLYARIKCDFLNLKPDYASIYIGVNDAWHEMDWQNGIDDEKFERLYGMLLDEIYAALPDVKLMLIAPYVVPGTATNPTEDQPDRLEQFITNVAGKTAVVRRVAARYNLPLVELQPLFDAACEKAPAEHWSSDGVHPTPAGHELIKRAWLDAFATMV